MTTPQCLSLVATYIGFTPAHEDHLASRGVIAIICYTIAALLAFN